MINNCTRPSRFYQPPIKTAHFVALDLHADVICNYSIRGSYYIFYFPHAGPANPRVCGTYSDTVSYLQSENFPLLYQPNTDCEYRILRSASDICQVELYFSHFDVASDNAANCDRDYLEIKGAKYCGKRDGQRGNMRLKQKNHIYNTNKYSRF